MRASVWAAGCAVTAATAVTAVAAIGAGQAGAGVPAHAAALCPTRTTTVSGVSGFKFCGPASAKVKTGGKTYDFKGGDCTHNTAAGLTLQLSIGYSFAIINQANPNQGKPRFELQINKKHNQGTLESVDSGGKELTAENTNVKVTWKGKTPLTGTFKNGKLSGSWTCAGHIYSLQAG